jgi:hypothetical protein
VKLAAARSSNESMMCEVKEPPECSAAATADVDALLRHPLVRDLICEGEGMLMELAVLRSANSARCTAQQHTLALEEGAARAALSAAEAIARAACVAAAHAALVRRVCDLEQSLTAEEAAKEELRNFAELAQAQLHSSPPAATHDASLCGEGSSSPPIKARRGEHGSFVSESDVDSRRHSLEEITNLRGSVKRLRSVESSESGTPHDQRHRSSGAQRSPGALTRVRKTMH